ncbi:MAG: hypothetical protein QNJ09_11620 [Paracoccaceae bacterium]|nr:hypothetical protein [Paracoccaceae bacterium]
MDETIRDFQKRERAVRRKHQRMARGYVTKLGKDGLIEQRPDNKSGGIFTRLLLVTAIAFMAFKCLMLAALGEADYLERVALLEAGNRMEQIGAWLMQIDPVTAWAAPQITALFF